jgi:hypothetical protein
MKSLTSVMSFRLRIGILTSFIALVAMCTHCDAQCGYQTGTLCPSWCINPPPPPYPAASYGGNLTAYVLTGNIFCGDICGYVQTSWTQTSCTHIPAKALNERAFRELRQLAGERDILVPGCNGSFQTLKEPASATALTPIDLAMTNLSLTGYPSIRIEW